MQANFYASCVLMPRKVVFAAWDEAFPDRKQRVLQPAEPIYHPFAEIVRFESRIPGAALTESDDQVLENFAKPFAEKFLVSPEGADEAPGADEDRLEPEPDAELESADLDENAHLADENRPIVETRTRAPRRHAAAAE